jgi:hypothetical protein
MAVKEPAKVVAQRRHDQVQKHSSARRINADGMLVGECASGCIQTGDPGPSGQVLDRDRRGQRCEMRHLLGSGHEPRERRIGEHRIERDQALADTSGGDGSAVRIVGFVDRLV